MISVIIVNYRTKHYLTDCLEALVHTISGQKEVIVVDNNSGDNLDDLSARYPEVQIIYHNANDGFGSGINRGAREASGDWIVCINPDTQIQSDPRSVLEDQSEAVAVVGFALMASQQEVQKYQFGSFPTPWTTLIGQEKRTWSVPRRIIFDVDWVSGGAMAIRKDVFLRQAGFDERFFMYFEDIDLCRRIHQSGYRIRWSKYVTLLHAEGGSQLVKYRMKERYYASQRKYFAKWFHPWWSGLFWPIHWLLVRILAMVEKRQR